MGENQCTIEQTSHLDSPIEIKYSSLKNSKSQTKDELIFVQKRSQIQQF
jgi:hypothetical protein